MSTSLLFWIVLLAPLVSAALIVLGTRKAAGLSAAISVAACLVSFVASVTLFFRADEASGAAYEWIRVGDFSIRIGFILDSLSKAMLLVVTGIGSLIHVYSLGYMKDDSGKARFFAGLSIFMFSMLGIVLADNFVMMFIFWELVGVSSYLLIGHWFERPAAADASKKAFLVNRIGDFGFMIGILMLWLSAGSFAFADLEASKAALAMHPAYLTAAVLLVFCGAVGKSAQFPLHVWLPDAMEGPTPVSALIHAATMVAAGVYMLARVGFLVAEAHTAQMIIGWVGMGTALLAALMAVQQDDIKRILAYSTLSQLGYMVSAAGLAAGDIAMFHLFTHAFFKALLFLGAGAVIHMLHHEQNIWKMGGLLSKMPFTSGTFAVGTLALVGFPMLSGFFSKDAILAVAYDHNRPMFWVGAMVAVLTAFYMSRLFLVAFLGAPRSHHAEEAREAPPVMFIPLILLAIPSVFAGYGFVTGPILKLAHHEAPRMVMIVATAAFVIGALGAFALYRSAAKDPIRIPFLANRFRIDDLYQWLVRNVQDLLATVAAIFDRWILDTIMVRIPAGAVRGMGFALRFLQIGNLQAYALISGLGIVLFLYLIIFN